MFLIGEFSKISRVSKRLLRYYDAIDLLKPAHIDEETGYRYYSANQLSRLNRILALKDLGLSLEQITQMLEADISDDEIQGMLLLKKAEAEQALLEDLQRLRLIETRLQLNQSADRSPDVVIKSIPTQPFLAARVQFPTSEELMQYVAELLHVVPAQLSPTVLGAFAGIFFTDDFSQTNHDVELGFFLKRPFSKTIIITDEHRLSPYALPAVETMATAVQVGAPDPVLVGLNKIAHWIEANGYRIAGPYREIGYGVTSTTDLSEVAIEIQIPIEKVNSPPDLKLNLSK